MKKIGTSRRGFLGAVAGATVALAITPAMLSGCGNMSGSAPRSGPLGPVLMELGLVNHIWEFRGEITSGEVVSYEQGVLDVTVDVNGRPITRGVANYTVSTGDEVSVTLV